MDIDIDHIVSISRNRTNADGKESRRWAAQSSMTLFQGHGPMYHPTTLVGSSDTPNSHIF